MSELALTDYEKGIYGYEDDIDAAYLKATAAHLAAALREGRPCGASFQPGDATRYALVFTPLAGLDDAPPRVVGGREWDAKSVQGVGEYAEGVAALVSLVEGRSYPIRFYPRGHLSADYIAEHWKVPEASAITLALLFRAIATELAP